MTETYFFGTYALFELIRGKPKYEKYINCKGILTIFNLAELNYNLKKEMTKKQADDYINKYKDFLVTVTLNDIQEAMDPKTKRRNLSIPDAIGYTIAKRFQVKFLTGDSDFIDLSNVEFVQK